MPLLREWTSDPYSRACIWRIEEPESFFRAQTGLHSSAKSTKRRLEHLAGRYLLRHLNNDFPLQHIFSDDKDKPRVPGNQFYFSLSHSFPFAAAVISQKKECGIDVQIWHPKILQLQSKFLSSEEQMLFENDPRLVTAAWCAKEALYKWRGQRGTDFIRDMPIKTKYYDKIDIEILFDAQHGSPLANIRANCLLASEFACSVITHP